MWPGSVQRTGWRAAGFVGLSAAVHAVLLAFLTLIALPHGTPSDLIFVSLRAGGGNAGSAGENTAGSGAEGAAQPIVGPEAAASVPPQPATHPEAPRRRRMVRHRTPDPAAPVPPMEAAQADSAARIGDSGDGNGAAADAPGNGHGAGVGSTDGSGSGSGSGTGFGGAADQRASCIYCPEPRYPLIARVRGWQGTVDVGLLVLADGSVDAAQLRRSSGYGALDDAAIAVARRSRFQPPASNGLPAPLKGRIEYRFELTAAH